MAADLSDPALATAINSVADPVSPISWIALNYHSTIEKTLVLLSTGFDPWVPQWQELLEAHKSEPIFGYGIVAKGRPMREGGEKGVVLVYLPDTVTGVRRARAVVHSRALANKFPDYSAIITISHPSEITEELVREQVNFYNQPISTPTASPVKPRTAAQMGLGVGLGRPSNSVPAPVDKGNEKSLPSPTQRAIQPSGSSIQSSDRPLPPPPAVPLDLPDNPRLNTPTPPRLATPPPGVRQSSDSMSGSQHQHGRKDSLSSRFAKALPSFTKSSKGDVDGAGGDSPKSPSRFGALTSGFGTGAGRREEAHARSASGEESIGRTGKRYVSDGTAPYAASPTNGAVINLDDPAGSSPHDLPHDARYGSSAESSAEAGPNTAPISRSTDLSPVPEATQARPPTSLGSDSIPPPVPPKTTTRDITPTPPAFNRLHTLGAIVPQKEMAAQYLKLQPGVTGGSTGPGSSDMSPNASAVFSTARAKQVDAETRVHEEFRRTEEERTRIRVNSGNRAAGIVRTPTPMMQHDDYDDDEGLPYDRPDVEEVREQRGTTSGPMMENGFSTAVRLPEYAEHAPERDDEGKLAEEEALRQREAEERIQAESEAARVRDEEERLRVAEAKEAEREQEALRVRELEEQMRRKEAEDARLREEEEQARQLHLTQEREAIAAKRAEEEEAALRAKLQAEAEARAEAMEAEREKAKKRDKVRDDLIKGKQGGGIMLSGHVTVQTTKSVTWRRRHFQLLPTELRLFKTQTDTTPIQTISLARGTQVSQTYEESQVQGSFKIISAGDDGLGEAFFLFSDSAEEKEVLLEGLSIALGQ